MPDDPIVIELQRLASDGKCPVDELLRKALIVASKLELTEFRSWIICELDGYSHTQPVPSYRQITASYPYKVPTCSPRIGRQIHHVTFTYPLTEPVGAIARHYESGREIAHIPEVVDRVPTNLDDTFIRYLVTTYGLKLLDESSLFVILDVVRNTILKSSLELERQGILGEGMRFTSAEKAIAMTSQNIHIGSFQGILGDVAGSTVNQSQSMSVTAGDFNSLQQRLTDAGIAPADLESLREALTTDPKPTSPSGFGPKVSAWIGTMMTHAASGAWKVTLETAGKMLPTSIADYYGMGG